MPDEQAPILTHCPDCDGTGIDPMSRGFGPGYGGCGEESACWTCCGDGQIEVAIDSCMEPPAGELAVAPQGHQAYMRDNDFTGVTTMARPDDPGAQGRSRGGDRGGDRGGSRGKPTWMERGSRGGFSATPVSAGATSSAEVALDPETQDLAFKDIVLADGEKLDDAAAPAFKAVKGATGATIQLAEAAKTGLTFFTKVVDAEPVDETDEAV